MRLLQIGMATMILLLGTAAAGQSAKQLLPTGQAITPLAAPGAQFTPLVARTGPHPAYAVDGAAAIAVSPDNREMLILTSGFNRYNGRDSKPVEKQSTQYVFRYAISESGARWLQTLQVPNSFGGIAWRPDGRGFVVGGGVDDALYLFERRGSRFATAGRIILGHKAGLGADVRPQAAGVAVSPDGRRALVANYYNEFRQPRGPRCAKSCRRAGSSSRKNQFCRIGCTRRRISLCISLDRWFSRLGLVAPRSTARCHFADRGPTARDVARHDGR